MNFFVYIFNRLQDSLQLFKPIDFLAPLLLRLYLAPIFWMAGTQKINYNNEAGTVDLSATIAWFGNTEWGLGLPYPEILAWTVTLVELVGAVFLLFGLATRWACIPLMVTMVVAAVTVHWQYGWLTIATGGGNIFATTRTIEAMERLEKAKSLLNEHGDYSWLTEQGTFVILNNGIEFAATYFIMLLALFYLTAGKLSIDYLFWYQYRA